MFTKERVKALFSSSGQLNEPDLVLIAYGHPCSYHPTSTELKLEITSLHFFSLHLLFFNLAFDVSQSRLLGQPTKSRLRALTSLSGAKGVEQELPVLGGFP